MKEFPAVQMGTINRPENRMTNTSRVCPKCGATVFADAPQGCCSVCLVRTGLASLDDESDEASEPTIARMLKDFGDYELLEEIGRGGQGVVYRARQKSLNRIVALKVIGLAHWATEAHVKRFRLEAEAAASLNHPCIVPIYEVGERDGACYFSMGLVEGGQLDAVAKREPMPIRHAAELIAKLARTVHYAHERGILHRDIKPGNILLDAKGEPHLTDFGLARLVETESTVTRTMEVLGTPSYMAPEQAVGNNARVTSATDIYGLGAVFYQLLTGHPPFAGGTTYETVQLVLDTEPRQPRLLNPKTDRDLATICLKCLDKDPQRRYSSALALAEDLERWLKHEPIRARRTGIFTRGRKWGRRNRKLVATGAASLLVGAAAIWLFRGELFRAPQFNPPEKSIAVVPFLDLSQAKDQEYFCDGISEEILHALAKVDGLRVTGRTSSFSFKESGAGASEIGKKLNVENVLEGSLRREGNRVRISAELINARSGFHLWSETFDRELEDVFALQDEITRSIVDALKIKLAVSLPAREQRNTEVYDLYLQGLFFSNRSSEEDLRRALSFFRRALEKDPTFARAWTGIAKVWYFLADVYVKPLEAYPASKEAALKAIALDEKDAEAHCYLSEAKGVLDWDLAGADAELKRALELDPNSAPAHFFSALVPLFRGELKEGLRLVLEAKKLDPVSPITSYVATAAYLANDQIDDAISEGQRTLLLDPNYFYLDSDLAAAYREKGNFAEAIALYTKSQSATNLPSSGLAITYTRMGRQTEARNVLAQLLQAREKRYVSAPVIAAVYVALGDKEEAFRWLERAFAEHSGILQWIAFLPEFRPLHSDARFPHLLRRIGVSRSILAITETTLSKTNDPNAESHFTLKVGVKPRPGTQNGHTVRIIVSFYDLTKDNRMKPTDARVGYDWLTPASDWADATPKFLAATYVRPKTQTPSADGRRYGGFIVRVYFDGQLQDSRANPPDLLTLFPAEN
ncbi:MAG: tetratricopeptide repeat protein [Verrucomicrobia bacterium]|nr:MAG: tetratricopeptide repeat protein [Verrucomicrobiota bacterium]